MNNIIEIFKELLTWADNWLPDEAKDQGAREVINKAKQAIFDYESTESEEPEFLCVTDVKQFDCESNGHYLCHCCANNLRNPK